MGLNSTRALTILQSRGGFNVTPAGRVQTPTLAILTQRELEIQAFEPEPYSEVWAEFDVQSGSYSGRWIDRDWKKNDHPTPARSASGIRNRRPSSATAAVEKPAR